jgi:hypothetical protein
MNDSQQYFWTGWKLHLLVYVLCVAAGLVYMSQQRWSDTVALAGDEWEYQSIAVNMIHGHGFPVSGGYEDSTVYKLHFDAQAGGSQTWHDFYTGGRGYDFYRNPVYPLFISAVYSISGVSPDVLRRVQFLLLILAGSMLPYLCCRMSLPRGMLIGVMAYAVFLFLDHSYASDVMCEALIVAYTIVFVLWYVVLSHRQKVSHAVAVGVMMGIGLLLKNYFLPLFLFIVAYECYLAFISKKTSSRTTIALLLGITLTILPWSIYANHQLDKTNPGHPIVIITTQGDDVLLGSNNEYSADGHWHPEWSSRSESFYNRPDVKEHPGWWKVSAFYAHDTSVIPFYFSSKIMMGLFATLSQLAFYLSMLGFVIVYQVRQRPLILGSLIVLAVIVLAISGHIHSLLSGIADSSLNVHHMLRYPLIAITIAAIWIYYRIQVAQSHRLPSICWLLLANFALLTLVFYGNSRITGVVDFVCLIFAFYNLSEIVTMLISARQQTNNRSSEQ